MLDLFVPLYISEELIRADSIADLRSLATKHLDDLGFSHVAFCLGWQKSTEKVETLNGVFSDYPAEWSRRYVQNNYMKTDLVHRRAINSVTPFSWSSMQRHNLPNDSARLFNEASEFKIFDGITAPMRSNNNLFSILSAVAEGTQLEREETIRRHAGNVMILASLLHERAQSLLGKFSHDQNQTRQLSGRELDVLKWSSSGKTSADIADILSISISTVNKHIEHILEKFQTSTRTHAAVKAVILGLIDPV